MVAHNTYWILETFYNGTFKLIFFRFLYRNRSDVFGEALLWKNAGYARSLRCSSSPGMCSQGHILLFTLISGIISWLFCSVTVFLATTASLSTHSSHKHLWFARYSAEDKCWYKDKKEDAFNYAVILCCFLKSGYLEKLNKFNNFC